MTDQRMYCHKCRRETSHIRLTFETKYDLRSQYVNKPKPYSAKFSPKDSKQRREVQIDVSLTQISAYYYSVIEPTPEGFIKGPMDTKILFFVALLQYLQDYPTLTLVHVQCLHVESLCHLHQINQFLIRLQDTFNLPDDYFTPHRDSYKLVFSHQKYLCEQNPAFILFHENKKWIENSNWHHKTLETYRLREKNGNRPLYKPVNFNKYLHYY